MTSSTRITPSSESVSADSLTIYPSRWKFYLLILAVPILSLFGLFVIDSAKNNTFEIVGIIFGFILIFFSFLCFAAFSYSLFARLPRLVLDHNGVRHITVLRIRSWAWPKVGPFSVGTASSGLFQTSLFACAYTNENHRLMAGHSEAVQLKAYDADISIDLSPFPAGSKSSRAQELVDTLNHWREKFGGLKESRNASKTKSEADQLLKTKRIARIIFAIIFAAMSTAALFFMRTWLAN